MPNGAPCSCGSLLLLTGLIPPLRNGSWALKQTGVRSWDWIALSPLTVIVHLLNFFSHPFILWMLAIMRPWSSQCGILKLEKSGQRQQTNPFIILGANNVKHFHLQTSTEGGCTLCDVPGAEKVSVHTLSVCRHLVSFLAGLELTFGTFGNWLQCSQCPSGPEKYRQGPEACLFEVLWGEETVEGKNHLCG